jgi:hypothetical protein
LLVLGDSPQTQTDGRQAMGRWLPVSSRGAPGRKAGAGRFSKRTIPGGRVEILFLTADQYRDCAPRWSGNYWNGNCRSDYPGKTPKRDVDGSAHNGNAVPVIADPSRGELPRRGLLRVAGTIARGSLRDGPEQLLRGRSTSRELTATHPSGFVADRSSKNTKIVYLLCQSAAAARTNCLFCPKLGTGTVQVLIKRFALLGFEGQYWMLVSAGLIAVFIFFVWKTRQRN